MERKRLTRPRARMGLFSFNDNTICLRTFASSFASSLESSSSILSSLTPSLFNIHSDCAIIRAFCRQDSSNLCLRVPTLSPSSPIKGICTSKDDSTGLGTHFGTISPFPFNITPCNFPPLIEIGQIVSCLFFLIAELVVSSKGTQFHPIDFDSAIIIPLESMKTGIKPSFLSVIPVHLRGTLSYIGSGSFPCAITSMEFEELFVMWASSSLISYQVYPICCVPFTHGSII
mmetsp:Transcript_5254/g.6200  ORF Transcript_5254/g.6200 Transcript_5254/m.6200 type:complete len:230 (-) Transcript_5254:510-1199(-)